MLPPEIREQARILEEQFFRPDAAREKPRLNPLQSEIRQTLTTPGWRLLFMQGFAPTVREWRNALIWNPGLDSDERIALQRAMAVTYEGFKRAYEQAKLPIPHWITKEFVETSNE